MEISGKVLREVEFRDRLRGYDTDEVDEFLEKVAVAVDEMHAEIERLASREPVAAIRREEPSSDDESIRKMLVLAQRTADLAVSEARDEADRLLAEARSQSEAMLLQAQEAVRRMREDAEGEVNERIGRLEGEHERLEGGIRSLASLLESERARLTEGLAAALRFVDETLAIPGELAEAAEAARASDRREPTPRRGSPSPDLAERSVGPASLGARGGDTTATPTVRELPDVEAEISADAATAAARDEPGAERGRFSAAELSGLAPAIEADEELWARWAAGGGLQPTDAQTQTVTRIPAAPRLDRRPATGRGTAARPSDGPPVAPSA